MKTRNSKTTRKITMLLSAIMLSEQLASTGAVLYAHAEDVTPAEYTIEHNVTSSWDGGCSAEIILTNQAEVDTENWSVTFCTRDEITNLWGGKITECEELLVSDASVEMDDVTDAEEVSETVEETESDETETDEVETEEAVAEETTEEESTEETEEVEEAEEETDTAEEVEEVSEDEIAEDETEEDAVEEETEEPLEEELLEEELEEEAEEESEEDNLYYRYTVEALDYNAVIPAGGSITIGYNANGEDHEIWDAQAEIVLKEVEVEEERNPEGSTYEGDGYTVEVVIPAYWDGAYNVQLRITNTSEETLHNWAFVMETKDTISGLYNAVELSDKDGVRLIKNAGYNQDIPAGSTVEVGYTANYDGDFDVPVDFALSQIEKEVTTAECEVSLFVTEEWENGGLAEIILTNISELPIEDWMLEFDSTLEIEEMWGGVIENHEGEHYFIRNAEYAQNIMPGESWTIGMLFSGDAADIRNVEVRQIAVEGGKKITDVEGILTVSKDHMTLNEDGNYVLDADFTMFEGELARVDEVTDFIMQVYDKNDILIYETDIIPAAEWTNDDFAFIYGLDRFVFEVSFGDECYSEELIIDCDGNYNFDKLNLDLDDNDGDGLQNYLEVYFGSDENKVDTDDDGLTDYQELYTLGYNPCDPDTDADGILDRDEDADEDGIGNKAEYDMGANPISIDSDRDKLLDSIEISYGTSLITEDTDNDGISDYDEYTLDQMGAVYNSADGTYTATFSVENMNVSYDMAVIPTITITGDATSITSFSMEMIEGDCYLNSSMVGYMGHAYDFSTNGNMVSAELTFTYDESLLDPNLINSEDFYPAIYCFNPDELSFTEAENQTWSGNKVTAHLEHFSEWILINKAAREKFFSNTIPKDIASGIVDGIDSIIGEDKATLDLTVVDSDGNPVPFADVYIYSVTTLSRSGAGGVMLYAGTDLKDFQMWGKTDGNGKLMCTLNSETIVKSTGCYTIFVDKDHAYGGTKSIASTAWEHFSDGLTKGEVRKMEITITPYADSNMTTVDFGVHYNNSFYRYSCLYEYNVRVYNGWGLTELSNPIVDVISTPDGFWNETYAVTIPKGLYTVEFEKEGYPKKRVEFLAAGNMTMPLLVTLDGQDISVKKSYDDDQNHDGLSDELTKLICQGRITTITLSTVFTGTVDDPTWEEVYKEIMSRSDFDYDLLKNGEEISIYYDAGRPFIKIHSNPELINSDMDDYLDYDEIKTYGSNPLVPDSIIYNDDYAYLNNHQNFESGKSYDEYLDRSTADIFVEYAFNTVILGGDANINKAVTLELMDLFVKYEEQNYDYFVSKSAINTANNLIRLTTEAGKALPAADRIVTNSILNALERKKQALNAVSRTINTELSDLSNAKSALEGEIVKVNNHLNSTKVGTIANVSNKVGGYLCLGLTVCSATSQTRSDLENYCAGLEAIKNYEYIIKELMNCGDGNIEEAARNAYVDVTEVITGYTTALEYLSSNFGYTGAETAASWILANSGKFNLALDVLWVGTIIVDHKALNNKITNAITVQCADSFRMPIHNVMSNGTRKVDSNSRGYTIFSDDSDTSYRELMRAYCFARAWMEAKYYYILTTQDSWLFLDGDHWLYQDENSEETSYANMKKALSMMQSY